MAKAYFSFCYNGTPVGRRDQFTKVEVDAQGAHKYAFVVATKTPDETFQELTDEPLFYNLLGSVLFGLFDQDRLVISSKPDMLKELIVANADTLLYVRNKTGTIHQWPVRQLYRACISPIKLGLSCNTCKKHNPQLPGDCYLRQIISCAQKEGLAGRLFVPADEVLADSFTPKQFDKFVSNAVKGAYCLRNGYSYIPPRKARPDLGFVHSDDQPVPYLRYYDTLLLDAETIAGNQKDTHTRATASALSRKNQNRCRKECVFAPCPLFSSKGSSSWVTSCWESSSFPGPFSQQDIDHLYRTWFQSLHRKRSAAEISFIAHNAGVTAHARGYGLSLVGLDSNLDTVEFIRWDGNSEYYSFENAMTLLHMPWRVDGNSYDRLKTGIPPDMSEQELWTYAELRQHAETPGYHTRWGWASPRVKCVEWCYRSFRIASHCGNDRLVSSLHEAIELFGIDNTLRHPDKIKALQAAAAQEPKKGTQL